MEDAPLSKRPDYTEFRDRILSDLDKKGEVMYSHEFWQEAARLIGCSTAELIGIFTSTNLVIMEPVDDLINVYKVTKR